VHAKLLTGGLVPLAATVASESIYDVFLGDEKRDALLHGHSYTAHAVGCAVAEASVKELLRIEGGEEWEAFRASWGKTKVESVPGAKDGVWSMWSPTFLDNVSRRGEVESVVALGSVLAIKLRDENPGMSPFLSPSPVYMPHLETCLHARAGYTSTAAIGLQSALSRVEGGFGIHSRVLGNVFYVMASQTTMVDVVRGIEERVIQAL
jgi:dethiobiotin synthetase/adenosylmethionine--8-amino-7-oxononanoate aminotransferase